MVRTSSVIALPLSASLGGCGQSGSSRDELKSQLAATRARVEKAEATVSALRDEFEQLKRQRDIDDLLKDFDRVAYLTPGAEAYSTVKCDLGVLTIQLADVQPYANGSKVVLRLGNTLSSSIDGLKSTIDWGRVDASGTAINEGAKSKEITFSQTLRGGAWTSVPLVLDGLPPSELGFVRLSKISHTGIRLIR